MSAPARNGGLLSAKQTHHRRYRVIQPAKNPKETPVAALHLAEDMMALSLVIQLLRSIEPGSVTASDTQAQRDFGRDMMQATVLLIQTWHRYAKLKMRKEFLQP